MKTTDRLFHKAILLACLLSLLFTLTFCSGPSTTSKLKDGIWKAELQRDDGHHIVFNFEVADSADQKVIYILNADNRLLVDSIVFEGDSVFIQMPFFDSHFEAGIKGNSELSGKWVKNYGTREVTIPFHAVAGDSTRLIAHADPAYNVTGSWEATFLNTKSKYKPIGLFDQEGQKVTGTFLTPVGDSRFLQGIVSGDTLKLSEFDGSHATLYTAIIDSAKGLTEGKLYALNREVRHWNAIRKNYDSLPEAYAVSNIPQGTVKLDFTLKNMQTNKAVSINDDIYDGKVVVISILGSWCPNCMDEIPFMTKYYDNNRHRGVEFIGIDFERTADFEASKKALNSFLKRFDINYPILFSGVASSDPGLTEKVFPNLPTKIHAFPTTIFIDKSGYVRKVHSGFNGPATGKYYHEFKEEFKAIVNDLLIE